MDLSVRNWMEQNRISKTGNIRKVNALEKPHSFFNKLFNIFLMFLNINLNESLRRLLSSLF